MREFVVVGAGMGTPETLTNEAADAILGAARVFAAARLAEGLRGLRGDIETCGFSDMAARAAAYEGEGAVALLVSGDTGFYSAAPSLVRGLEELGRVCVLPGVGSVAYLCARLGVGYEDARLISLHGRDASLIGAVSYNRRVLALTGGRYSAGALCAMLDGAGLSDVRVRIGEKLGAADERILAGTVRELRDAEVSGLAVLLAENENFADRETPLRDADFARGDTPMTKEEVRWTVAAKLAPGRRDVVFDVGAGTGSCSAELARRADMGMVYAIERDAAALALLAENRARTGCFNIKIVAANAPEGLDALPAPDCVFLGGSGGRLREILDALTRRNPSLRAVATAITLETLHEASEAMEAIWEDVEIVQITAARSRRAGKYHMLTGANPVFIISGGGART
jgi:precorrin-6Y C5,15-methyltransferase (decarboxylating)